MVWNEKSFSTHWSKLNRSFSIFLDGSSQLNFKQTLEIVNTIFVNQCGEQLVEKVKELLAEHLQKRTLKLVAYLKTKNFLRHLNQFWNDYAKKLKVLQDVFQCMERGQSIQSLGLKLFHDKVIASMPLNKHLRETFHELMARCKSQTVVGNAVGSDSSDLQNIVQMLISLGGDSLLIFWSESYDIMLNEIFSSDESSTTTANCILAETYLCKISQWFCAECKRIEQFQPDKRLIEALHSKLNNESVHFQLIEDATSAKLNIAVTTDETFLEKSVDLIQARALQIGLIEALIAAKKLYERQRMEFNGQFARKELELVKILDDFERIGKALQKQITQNLAPCIDTMLNSQKNASEVPEEICEMVSLCKYIDDDERECFGEEHQALLAERLLKLSTKEGIEMMLLERIAAECGLLITKKMDAMLQDLMDSRNLMAEFNSIFYPNESNEQTTSDVPEISINVLSKNNWPEKYSPSEVSTDSCCILPQEVSSVFDNYMAYYMGKYDRRRICLNNKFGVALIEATFESRDLTQSISPNKIIDANQKMEVAEKNVMPNEKENFAKRSTTKFLETSTFQMIVLLCFNHVDQITFEQLQDFTQIPAKELQQVLLSLTDQKHNVLCRNDNGDCDDNKIEKTDVFSVNNSFSSELEHIELNTFKASTSGANCSEENTVKNFLDQKYLIDAVIVRIMKKIGRSEHKALIDEVTKQLDFDPDQTEIKRRIESLIERDFISRDEADSEVYNYVV